MLFIHQINSSSSSLLAKLCNSVQAILPELEAIRGHRSAHSFATGPVTVEPVQRSWITAK